MSEEKKTEGLDLADLDELISKTAGIVKKKDKKEQEFKEEIDLPPDVDIENTVENFKNGILEITLPKKMDKRKNKKKN